MTRITRFCSSLLVIMGFAVMTAANAQELHINPQKVTGPDARMVLRRRRTVVLASGLELGASGLPSAASRRYSGERWGH